MQQEYHNFAYMSPEMEYIQNNMMYYNFGITQPHFTTNPFTNEKSLEPGFNHADFHEFPKYDRKDHIWLAWGSTQKYQVSLDILMIWNNFIYKVNSWINLLKNFYIQSIHILINWYKIIALKNKTISTMSEDLFLRDDIHEVLSK